MIIGFGNDLIDIRRIEKSLERFGERFENRLFTPLEQKKARGRRAAGARITASTYAKRFAAKEACSKALGTGMTQGVRWLDMEVINLPSGAPSMQLYGAALQHLERLVPKGMRAKILLSLSDDYPQALAQVIIEAVPR